MPVLMICKEDSGYLYQLVSGEFTFTAKKLALWKQQVKFISCTMVCKIFFCTEFSDTPEKSRRAETTNSKLIEEFESRWMTTERKSIWTVRVINECNVYWFFLR